MIKLGVCACAEDEDRLGFTGGAVRRVSDISHINQLRREISGLSHLASEFYEVKKADPDNLSLDRYDETTFIFLIAFNITSYVFTFLV